MQYIGIDIIEISRIEEAVARWGEGFLKRIYTGQELELCRNRISSLAVRFAGKEAVVKALGNRTEVGFRWKDIEILSESSGRPVVRLYGKARKQASTLGLNNVHISLSHSREYAIALASGE